MSVIQEAGNDQSILLEAHHLVQEFAVRGRHKDGSRRVVHALSNVSLTIRKGETFGIVGETGSGKSTLARAVMAAPKPLAGQVIYRGQDLLTMGRAELRQARRGIQMVHQDPFDSLDPNWSAMRSICEPLNAYRVGSRAERRARALDMLKLVGLDPDQHAGRRPRQLSGGQCQRVAIARALALSPDLIVCDEAVSSLDVLVQAQVLNLFDDLRSRMGLSYLFIAHDLATVKQVSDRVGVMYLGKIVEVADSESLFRQPRHPYTAALLESIPAIEPGAKVPSGTGLHGEPPSPTDPPSGCRFRTRCPLAAAVCAEQEPELRIVAQGQSVACHFPLGAPIARPQPAAEAVTGPPSNSDDCSPSVH